MNMKQLRERTGLRTVDVASRLGIAEATVRGWEKGKGTPNFLLIKPLANLYGVTFEELDQSVRQTLKEVGRLHDQ
jgi:transcriptional regulator with XRE-family HTH domain